MRSRSRILPDLSDPCGVYFDFLPLVLCTQVYGCAFLFPALTTHRPDSEKPGGLDLFSNVPFPHDGSQLRGEWEIRNFFGKRLAL